MDSSAVVSRLPRSLQTERTRLATSSWRLCTQVGWSRENGRTQFGICGGIIVWMGHVGEVSTADGVELIRHCRVLSFVVATEAEEGRHVDVVVLLAPIAWCNDWRLCFERGRQECFGLDGGVAERRC